jgi:KaiC/GvpD/RAD55 family RecA-like ATPase
VKNFGSGRFAAARAVEGAPPSNVDGPIRLCLERGAVRETSDASDAPASAGKDPGVESGVSDSTATRLGRIAVSLADVSKLKLPKPRWLIEPILPRCELAMLYGEPKVGKTWVALEIARVLATSGEGEEASFFGTQVTGAGVPVLYVTPESTALRISERAEVLRFDKNARATVLILTRELVAREMRVRGSNDEDTYDIAEPGSVLRMVQDECDEIRSKVGKPPFVILDPLNQFIGTADLSKPDEISPYIKKLERLAREGFTSGLLAVHHERKRGQTDRPDRDTASLYGSYLLASRPRAFIRVVVLPRHAELRFWGNYVSDAPPVLLARDSKGDRDSLRIPFVLVDPADLPKGRRSGSESEARLLRYLEESDRENGWSATELDRAGVGKRRTLLDALQHLEAREKLERVGKSSFRLRRGGRP